MILSYKSRHHYEGRGKYRTRITTSYQVFDGDRFIAHLYKVKGGYKIYYDGGESFGKSRLEAVENFLKP